MSGDDDEKMLVDPEDEGSEGSEDVQREIVRPSDDADSDQQRTQHNDDLSELRRLEEQLQNVKWKGLSGGNDAWLLYRADEVGESSVVWKSQSFAKEYKRLKLAMAPAMRNVSKLLQTIPYDITLIILDFQTPRNYRDIHGDLLEYYGYFARDRTRKLYLVFRALKYTQHSGYLARESPLSIVPWRQRKVGDPDEDQRGDEVHRAIQHAVQLDKLSVSFADGVGDPSCTLALAVIPSRRYLTHLSLSFEDIDVSAVKTLCEEFQKRQLRGGVGLQVLCLHGCSEEDRVEFPFKFFSALRVVSKRVVLTGFYFAWEEQEVAAASPEILSTPRKLVISGAAVNAVFLRRLKDSFQGEELDVSLDVHRGKPEVFLDTNFFRFISRFSFEWEDQPVHPEQPGLDIRIQIHRLDDGTLRIRILDPAAVFCFFTDQACAQLNKLETPFHLDFGRSLVGQQEDWSRIKGLCTPFLRELTMSWLRLDPAVCRWLCLCIFLRNPEAKVNITNMTPYMQMGVREEVVGNSTRIMADYAAFQVQRLERIMADQQES